MGEGYGAMGKRADPGPWWSIATLALAVEEAARSDRGEIESVHLLIALSRYADLNDLGHAAETENKTEWQRADEEDHGLLCAEFEAFGVAPTPFRRRLRAIIPKGQSCGGRQTLARKLGSQAGGPPGVLSGFLCSEAAKAAVRRAQDQAGQGRLPGARHLLRALLAGEPGSLADGEASPASDGLPDRI